MDEFEFVAEVAERDPDPKVKVDAVSALALRGADRHVAISCTKPTKRHLICWQRRF